MVYGKTKNRKQWVKDLISFGSVLVASFIMAMNIRTFVRAGELFPGGFNGLTVLIQRICETYFNLEIPYTIVNVSLNAIPAYISLKTIGKRFTIFSLLMIFFTSIFVDCLPSTLAVTSDRFLVAIFGGMINGMAIGIALYGRASSGGTDFIAVYLTEKFNIDSWNVVLGINACMLTVAGLLFGWDKALYSIIYQYVSTQILHLLYKKYQQETLLVVTDKPREVCEEIYKISHHGATIMKGEGSFKKVERSVIYSVVSSAESKKVAARVKEIDPQAFVNVMKTEQLYGRFYQAPNE